MCDDTKTTIDNDVPEAVKSTITIHRYGIRPFNMEEQCIQMHDGAEILHATDAMLWARVDTSKPVVDRRIVFVRTGKEIIDGDMGKYIATVEYHHRVRHLFDCGIAKS